MKLRNTFKKAVPAKIHGRPGVVALVALIVVVGAVLAAVFLLPKGERIDRGGYQVVYLLNNQAYFGKLRNSGGEYLVLESPFTAQDVQPEGEENEDAPVTTTLLKVSQQQYGPEDVISLKSDQVLFWQNLRDDSSVAETLRNAR